MSKLTPPLGSIRPETRHLNLKFTLADIGHVIWHAKAGHTAVEIAAQLPRLNATPEEIIKVCFDAGQYVSHNKAARK